MAEEIAKPVIGERLSYMGGLGWSSDWNGDEVGFPDRDVVGLYRWYDTEIMLYIDAETLEVLEFWDESEDYE